MQSQKPNSWTSEYLNAFDCIKTITTITSTVMDTYFIYKEERRMSSVTKVNLNIK